jgi:hypothetical protein
VTRGGGNQAGRRLESCSALRIRAIGRSVTVVVGDAPSERRTSLVVAVATWVR